MQFSPESELARVIVADDYAEGELTDEAFLGEQRWRACRIVLTVEQAEAVLAGKTLAVDIFEEYVGFISIEIPAEP